VKTIDEYLAELATALGKGGNDALIKNAISLLGYAKRDGRPPDMRLGANCPSYREAADQALRSVRK